MTCPFAGRRKMGKYNYVDREFFGESKNAAELITNIVYRRRLLVAPESTARRQSRFGAVTRRRRT